MSEIVFSDTALQPAWWRTDRQAVLHRVDVVRHHGDGHGPRYVGRCSCVRWGTVALIDQREAVDAVQRHLAYIRAIDAPDSPERTAILRAVR